MTGSKGRTLYRASISALLLAIASIPTIAQTTEINSSPSSLSFANTYVGKASGSKVLTINNLTTSGQVIIQNIGFSCPGFGISSGVAPFTLGQGQKITHYSVFFQPTAAQAYNCNFIINLKDGTSLNVPISGTGLTTAAVASVSPTKLSFPNQSVGTTSAPQTVTITNTGTTSLTLNSITTSPTTFTTNNITLPATINAGASLPVQVFYAPTQAISEIGALDFTYNSLPDNGSSLTGNGAAPSTLVISTSPTLPQATQSAAYQATLLAAGGTGPYTWSLGSGSSMPTGLTLSSGGVISGTLGASVAKGNYSFIVQVTDTATSTTASSSMLLTVVANLGANCGDLSFNVPNTSTPLVPLTDLGTGTYQGAVAGLYPNGSNVRPASHDADGVALALGIQPLDANGNPSPTGKYVLLAVGESTAQNEFNRFLPIANADPAKNPNLVIVNGAQGGATPNNFTTPDSVYWATTLNNYLPQNGVTANQVVAIWIEDTDGLATGTFPSDIANMQSEYETIMQTMHTLFPNLKLVYFSSRVYGGYSNGVGSPANPEPYAYEMSFAVKWAIEDQLNGNANLNYNANNGPVVAPWMAWGPYYWSNGMLGRNDGLVWNCADFSADGTHPSSTYGQLKVASALLSFLKTDNTSTPWYLAASLALTATGGNNQTGTAGTMLPSPLTVLASNLNGGTAQGGVSVTFSDGEAGGTFGTPIAVTDSTGTASTTYTLPPTAQTITISATSNGYTSASFTENSTVLQALSVSSGNGQTGGVGTTLPTALGVLATINGTPVAGVSVTFDDGGAGGTFGSLTVVTDSNGLASTTYTLPSNAQTVIVNASATGYASASFTETAAVQALAVNAGNNQSGNVGTTLPNALTVLATSNGTPVAGVTVNFSDGEAGGSFGSPSGTTDSNGLASTTYALPSTAQTVTVTASSSGYTSATFSETASVLLLAPNAGNNQSGNIGTTLPTPLTVLATANGVPAAGVSVAFSDGGAGGTFGTPTVTTDSNGLASSTYTLPGTAKIVSITASSTGYTSASFTETATSSVAALTVVSGGKQSGTVGSNLPLPIVIKAKNSSGGAVAGVSITFSDGATGSFSPNPAVTGTNGQASTTYTLPKVPKVYTVTASYGSVSVRVTESALIGPPTSFNAVGGNNQTAHINTTLPKQLVVKLTDQYNNAISGATITFTDNGAGGTFSSTTPVTNTFGQASVTYTTGPTTGTVTINASTPGVNSVTFKESVR